MTDSEYYKHVAVFGKARYFKRTALLHVLDLITSIVFIYLFHNYLSISKFMFIQFKCPFIDKKNYYA